MSNSDRLKFSILPMASSHIERSLALCRTSGWNQLREDWQRLIDYEPEGCFVAALGDQVIGTVTTTRYGRALGWIGMMLVDPDYRRVGIASALMERSVDYLTSKQVQCIKLDATPIGQRVYETLGFAVEWPFHRWVRPGCADAMRLELEDPVSDSKLPLPSSILELDRFAFGADRRQFLKRLAATSAVHVTRDGYGMMRAGFLASYLGPVSAANVEAAEAIIWELLKRTDRDVFWDIPGPNAAAIQIARSLGLAPIRDLTRMRLGRELADPALPMQFALADPGTG